MSTSVAAGRILLAIDVQPRLLAESIGRILLARRDVNVVDLRDPTRRQGEDTSVRYAILVTSAPVPAGIDADLVVLLGAPASEAAEWPGDVVCISRLDDLLARVDEWRSRSGFPTGL